MDQHRVDIVGVINLAVPVDGGQHVLRCATNLGLEIELLAGQTFDGRANPVEGPVALGAVDVRNALVVGVTDEPVEGLLTQIALDIAAIAARSEAQAAALEAGFAQRDLICRGAFGLFGREEVAGVEDCGAGQGRGSSQELPAAEMICVHGCLLI